MSSRQIRRLQNLILASEGEDYEREEVTPSIMQGKNVGKKKKKAKCKTEEHEISKDHSTTDQGNCNAEHAEQHVELQELEEVKCHEDDTHQKKGAKNNVKELQSEVNIDKNNNNKGKNKAKQQQLRMKKRQILAEEDALLDALVSNAEQQEQHQRRFQPWQTYDNELTSSTKTKERKSNRVECTVNDELQTREGTTLTAAAYANSRKKDKQMSCKNEAIDITFNSGTKNNKSESEMQNTEMNEECLHFDFISYLMSCDTTRMNTRLERIRAFGPASVEDIGDGLARNNLMGGSNGALSSSAAANNNSWSLFGFHNMKLAWKTNVFVSPNRYRWIPYDNLGIHLGLLNEDNKHSTHSSSTHNNKKKKDKTHKTYNNSLLESNTSTCSTNRYPLRYVLHCDDSPAFQRAEHRLQECISFAPQPNTLLECLLANRVYHLPSLKACYSMLMAMNETNKAGELADCAMYHVGEILKFFPLNGDWRRRLLPFYLESNSHIYWALKTGAEVARSRGCMRTTWEMHKLILSLNPHDPTRVLSVMDTPALQAKRWMWLVELMENAKRVVECEEAKNENWKHDKEERQNDEKEKEANTITGKDENVQWNTALARRLYLMPHLVYSAALAKHCLEREIKNLMTRVTSPLLPSSPLQKEHITSTRVKRHNSNSVDMSSTHDVCTLNRNTSKVLKELSNTQWEDLVASMPQCCKSNSNNDNIHSDNIEDEMRVRTSDNSNSKYCSAAEMLAEAMVQFPLMAVELVSALQGINTIVTRCGWQIAPTRHQSMSSLKNNYKNESNYADGDNDDSSSENKMVFVDHDAWSEIEDAANAVREHNSLHSLQKMCDFTSELVKARVELWKPTEMLQLIAQVIIIPVNYCSESILAKQLRQTEQEMQKHLLIRSTPLKFSLNREKRLSSLLAAIEKRAQELVKNINNNNTNTNRDKWKDSTILNLMKIDENDFNSMMQGYNNTENWTERAIAEMLVHYSRGGEVNFMNPPDVAVVRDPNELMNMMAENNNRANAHDEEQEVEMIYGGDSDNDYDDISIDNNSFIEDTSID